MNPTQSECRVFVPTPFGHGYWKTYLVYAAFLIVPLLIMAVVTVQPPAHAGGLRPTWFIALLATLWSGMSVAVFRMLVRHRYATTISLTAREVRYSAPPIGIIPAKEITARYNDIISIAPIHSHQPDLILVRTTSGVFTFDRRTMAELSTLGATGLAKRAAQSSDLCRELERRIRQRERS